jgi:hypothetical protein
MDGHRRPLRGALQNPAYRPAHRHTVLTRQFFRPADRRARYVRERTENVVKSGAGPILILGPKVGVNVEGHLCRGVTEALLDGLDRLPRLDEHTGVEMSELVVTIADLDAKRACCLTPYIRECRTRQGTAAWPREHKAFSA